MRIKKEKKWTELIHFEHKAEWSGCEEWKRIVGSFPTNLKHVSDVVG